MLNNRTILATQDGGETWARVHEATTAIGDLQFASPRAGWALSSGRLLATSDGGQNGQPVAPARIPALAQTVRVISQLREPKPSIPGFTALPFAKPRKTRQRSVQSNRFTPSISPTTPVANRYTRA